MLKKGPLLFVLFAAAWQIMLAVLYALFLGYNESALEEMSLSKTYPTFTYNYTQGSSTIFKANTTQFPFPTIVIALAIVLLVVGKHLMRQVWL